MKRYSEEVKAMVLSAITSGELSPKEASEESDILSFVVPDSNGATVGQLREEGMDLTEFVGVSTQTITRTGSYLYVPTWMDYSNSDLIFRYLDLSRFQA